MMSFGGTIDPCANINFSCIGQMGGEENKKYASKLCDFISNHLKIDKER